MILRRLGVACVHARRCVHACGRGPENAPPDGGDAPADVRTALIEDYLKAPPRSPVVVRAAEYDVSCRTVVRLPSRPNPQLHAARDVHGLSTGARRGGAFRARLRRRPYRDDLFWLNR